MENKKFKKEKLEIMGEVVNKFSEEDLFDDCLICQAVKASYKEGRELSLPELKEVFKKQNEKNQST